MELGQLMAVKQLNLSHMGPGARASEHEAAVRRVEKEVNFYRRLSHPHIVRYLVRNRRGCRVYGSVQGLLVEEGVNFCCRRGQTLHCLVQDVGRFVRMVSSILRTIGR